MTTEEGKKKQALKDKNELAFEELILSVDGTTKEGRVAFQLIKGCKMSDYEDGDAALAWKWLKNKFAATTAPSLVKLKKEFGNSKLSKGEDPDEWITGLEDLRVKIKDAGSDMTDEDFIIHIINNVTEEYDVEIMPMEEKIGASTNPLTIEELREI